MVGTRILVVDDDPNICDILKTHFESEGCEVITANDGVEGLSVFKSASPDIALLDVMMPKMDGQQLLVEIRKESQKPVIMVTAKGETFDKVLGLEMGAVLRRYQSHLHKEEDDDVIKYENFEISQNRFELKLRGKKVDIPPKELQLLYCLASNPNRVFSRELLLEHVWDFAFLGDSRTVDVHIKRLREKLEGVSDKWALKTVWGIGYKFELYN